MDLVVAIVVAMVEVDLLVDMEHLIYQIIQQEL